MKTIYLNQSIVALLSVTTILIASENAFSQTCTEKQLKEVVGVGSYQEQAVGIPAASTETTVKIFKSIQDGIQLSRKIDLNDTFGIYFEEESTYKLSEVDPRHCTLTFVETLYTQTSIRRYDTPFPDSSVASSTANSGDKLTYQVKITAATKRVPSQTSIQRVISKAELGPSIELRPLTLDPSP